MNELRANFKLNEVKFGDFVRVKLTEGCFFKHFIERGTCEHQSGPHLKCPAGSLMLDTHMHAKSWNLGTYPDECSHDLDNSGSRRGVGDLWWRDPCVLKDVVGIEPDLRHAEGKEGGFLFRSFLLLCSTAKLQTVVEAPLRSAPTSARLRANAGIKLELLLLTHSIDTGQLHADVDDHHAEHLPADRVVLHQFPH